MIDLDSLRAGAHSKTPSTADSSSEPGDDAAASAPSTSPSPPTPPPPSPTPPSPSGPTTASDAAALAQVVTLVNAARKQQPCPEVKVDALLTKTALAHSQDMAHRSYFNHNSPEGTDPWQRANAAGYKEPTGENIALGYADAKTVMDGWMKSPGHRANIVDCRARAIGVGLARGADGTVYWTQVFGAS